MTNYYVTYPSIFANKFIWRIWRKFFCRLNWHLWDEVFSCVSSGDKDKEEKYYRHYLHCDACGLMIEIRDKSMSITLAEKKIISDYVNATFDDFLGDKAKKVYYKALRKGIDPKGCSELHFMLEDLSDCPDLALKNELRKKIVEGINGTNTT